MSDNQRFFGIHFDFHAREDCNIGENTDEEQIQYLLDTVRPDYVQCDCKGHPGVASYPTQVGTPAPGFVKDNLKIWRDVTARNGVPLFVHYSGVFDMAAVRKHPEWAAVDENGQASENDTSLKSPYVDELLIPQIRELWENYRIDGVWLDGECWAVVPDYSERMAAGFREATGLQTLPKAPGDPGYYEYFTYLRGCFCAYLAHYTKELHRACPGIRLASNWAYTSYMPREVEAEVDFLSGDFSPIDSYNTARFEARYLCSQGKPWDLMAWSFVSTDEKMASTKTACQLKREAAAVLALGGGFQVYVVQNRDGSLEKWMLPAMGEVGDFCRERREVCYQGENVPQTAVFLSTYNYEKTARSPFFPKREYAAMQGLVPALLDSQLSVQLLSEHHDIDQYPVVVLPELTWLTESTLTRLRKYMERGGHVIACGPLCAQMFENEAGVRMERRFDDADKALLGGCFLAEELNRAAEENGYTVRRYLAYGGTLTGVNALSCGVTALEGTQVIGRLYEENREKGPSTPAATYRRVGKGSLTCVWTNLGERYLFATRCLVRDFLGDLVKRVMRPMVRVSGSHFVDVNISRKNGALLVHLVNTSGSHASERTYVYDEITPLAGLHVEVDCPVEPVCVQAVPEGNPAWSYRDNLLSIDLDRLDIYTILSIK